MAKLSFYAAVVGGTAATIYCGVKYATYRWIKAMAERSVEMNARQNLKYRFELNLRDCRFVVESLLPTLKDNLFEELNVELLTQQLKLRQGDTPLLQEQPKKHKREMWASLKITSFARTICTVYLGTLYFNFSSQSCCYIDLCPTVFIRKVCISRFL
jgi:Peroxin-3